MLLLRSKATATHIILNEPCKSHISGYYSHKNTKVRESCLFYLIFCHRRCMCLFFYFLAFILQHSHKRGVLCSSVKLQIRKHRSNMVEMFVFFLFFFANRLYFLKFPALPVFFFAPNKLHMFIRNSYLSFWLSILGRPFVNSLTRVEVQIFYQSIVNVDRIYFFFFFFFDHVTDQLLDNFSSNIYFVRHEVHLYSIIYITSMQI